MRKRNSIILCLVLFILCLTGCTTTETVSKKDEVAVTTEVVDPKGGNSSIEVIGEKEVIETKPITEIKKEEVIQEDTVSGDITVKFVDVGQGDACIIMTPNDDVIVIDTGDNKDADEVLEELRKEEFEDIDLMVLTHTHADHIDGAEAILNEYKTKEVLMSSFVTNTKTFESLLNCLEVQNIKTTQAAIGQEYNIDGVEIDILGVDSVPKDCNNSSIVLKLTYGDVDIMFTGDAEFPAEEVILANDFDFNCEVLKVGHHGSDTSTSDMFLEKVNPKMAIISVGEGNKYKHPAQITLDKLLNKKVQYYRTDELGTVILEIDGVNIVTSFSDNVGVADARSGRKISTPPPKTPDIPEVKIVDESVVLDEINK
jgi:beta-lactamase superfamily II metal-dependent hydrolase